MDGQKSGQGILGFIGEAASVTVLINFGQNVQTDQVYGRLG